MTLPRTASVGTDDVVAALLIGGLGLAVTVRVLVAGVDGAGSVPAGLVFGVVLLGVAGMAGFARARVDRRAVALGLAGAALLCAVPLAHRLGRGGAAVDDGRFAVWAGVVTLVAVAEELLLRGALFEAVRRAHGENAAIVVAAVAFAGLHVPVYGWRVLPLDLAVGVALGVVRVLGRSVAAPVLTHVGADLAGWWLR